MPTCLNDQITELTASVDKLVEDRKQAALPHYGQARDVTKRLARDNKGQDGNFKNMGDFLRFVKGHTTGPCQESYDRLKQYNEIITKAPTGLGETVGADGGILVPPEFASQLLMRTYDNDLLGRCTTLPMGSASMRIPAIDETSRADGSRFGGVQAYWRGEAAGVTASKPKFNEVKLDPETLEVIVRATEELLEDSGMALETLLGTIVESELKFKTGDAIVNGDGIGKPLGIRNSDAKVTVAKETSQAADTLLTANVLKMWSRLHMSCRPNAVWIYDQSIEPQLYTMVVGTSAPTPIFMPPGGLSGAQYSTILGRPAFATEFNQPLGDAGDIILFDPTSYLVGTRGGMKSAVSMHVYFLTSEQAFKFSLRMDGKPWWTSTLTPKSGGDSQSCIVELAARA